LPTKIFTKTDLGKNPGFCGEIPASYREKFIVIPERKNRFGDLDVDGSIVLEGIFSVQDMS
jgi:hypothetical protein